MVQQYPPAALDHPVTARLPHLSRPQARILELADKALDCGRAVVERRTREERARKREPLDPLRGPLGADLGAWNTPDLFCVGLEEDPIQPPAEAVRHPLLEVLFGRSRPHSGVQVAQEEKSALRRAEASKRVGHLKRVLVVFTVVQNS